MSERLPAWADPATVARHLAREPGFEGLGADRLQPVATEGAGHVHLRVAGAAALVRIPRFSQVADDPAAHLAYQAACFARAGETGRTPRLRAVLAVTPDLPRGGLVVDEIAGRLPRLPDDLGAIVDSLAALHALPLPAPAARSPVIDHGADPFGSLQALVERQMGFLDAAGVAPAAQAILRDTLAAVVAERERLAARPQPAALVAVDCHPGNFLIDGDGRAILVDLERMQYGAPAADIAHLTLPTSTFWDRRIDTGLDRAALAGAYRRYGERIGGAARAAIGPWLGPCRRLIWLRTLSWYARFLVETKAGAWADLGIDPALSAEFARRMGGFLTAERIAAMAEEWTGLHPFDPAAVLAQG